MKNVLAGMMAVVAFQVFSAQSTKDVGVFRNLKVYDKIHVDLLPSKTNKVEVGGSNASEVEVINKNGELKLRMSPAYLLQGEGVRVKVFYDRLTNIQANQGASIKGEGTLKAPKLVVGANEGASINMDLSVQMLELKSNTGAHIALSGSADHQIAVVNTGAQYSGRHLKTSTSSITVKAGGNAEVFAAEAIDAKTFVGGNIMVYGNPVDKKTKKIAGGNIQFK
ncbi:DUF2807 domain-containing protein [Elizabethkingia argentiflava]|uniref:DUF2807 domain-containing protein n=1 Tax=Elizabethkingia argenteiflava TaxID=2681556 RepID=A0A845PUW3_9FLAO|nr:head GIN domain-containing protein [Elizabethkingia argenteiflava]NAW51445.1 DUF2807 domain-containing protein [Elizabethkingia argenteiflava]